jgi:hypothetical protein
MCVVSMVMDHYWDKWREYQPWTAPVTPYGPYVPDGPRKHFPASAPALSPITPAEIAELRKLLERAREYDRKNNEPNCELEEKRERLKKLAEKLGVKIDFV